MYVQFRYKYHMDVIISWLSRQSVFIMTFHRMYTVLLELHKLLLVFFLHSIINCIICIWRVPPFGHIFGMGIILVLHYTNIYNFIQVINFVNNNTGHLIWLTLSISAWSRLNKVFVIIFIANLTNVHKVHHTNMFNKP